MNKIAKISHNESKDVLLDKMILRHSLNSIQNKDHGKGTYGINKI